MDVTWTSGSGGSRVNGWANQNDFALGILTGGEGGLE